MIRFGLNMSKKSKNNYRYYKSIDFLPIFNFFKVIETDDLRFLLKIEDYEILPDDADIKELSKAWESISNEYSKAENSNSSVIHFTTIKSLHKLELEFLMLWDLMNLIIIDENGFNSKECLIKAGLQGKDLKWIEKRIKALTNKINLKQAKIKEDYPQNKKDDWVKVLDKIEDIKGRKIDKYQTTVREYLATIENIKSDGKRQDREKGRNRSGGS